MSDALDGIEFRWAAFQFFTLENRVKFYRRLSRFAAKGYDVVQPLEEGLARARKGGRRREGEVRVYEALLVSINSGERVSDALAPYLPGAERMAVSVGEERGHMEEGFEMAEFIATSSRQLRSAVFGNLAYPAVLFVVLIALMLVNAYMLMPELRVIHPVDQWPLHSRALNALGQYVQSWGAVSGLVAAGLVGIALWTLPWWRGPIRSFLDRTLPPWSIYREVQGALLLVGMSGLVRAGLPFDEAVRQLLRISHPWLASHLETMLTNMAEGQSTSDALSTGLFGDELMDDLAAYDKAGDLASVISDIGREGVAIVSARVAAICRLTNALMMLAVGMGVVWVWVGFTSVVLAMRSANAAV